MVVGYTLMLQMPSAGAAISCASGEIQVQTKSVDRPTVYCYGCQDQCITQCKSQGREVSQVECNFWGTDQAICKCCCALPSSTPPPSKPIYWNQCPLGEKKRFNLLRNSLIDCKLCVNNCKTKCDRVGGTVTRQVCFQDFQFGTTVLIDLLVCPCCCKINHSLPPSPPPQSPPPPPPCPCSGSGV
ncbi:uncharacterized protein LOC113361744 isoform X1 [Papaver somniferum]|uniref:uncharacterized protein LOC113361744 isoform X1 n=1 Tax=Papaver somniferum TaxID=3469 RepID=UPI000E6F6E73|nr:uncharacterized protein LOC113361744 isoform X1 [Papaver somniferum]